MTEWLLGSVLLIVLLIKVLDYFEIIDVLDFLSTVLRLTGALMFGIASVIVWTSRKLFGKTNGEPKPG